jgi:hypothetical protein
VGAHAVARDAAGGGRLALVATRPLTAALGRPFLKRGTRNTKGGPRNGFAEGRSGPPLEVFC